MSNPLREKLMKLWNDGCDAARMLARQHLGKASVKGDPGSIYHIDLTLEARGIEIDLDGVNERLQEFLMTNAVGPSEAEKAEQRQLDLDDALARQRAEEAAARAREDLGVNPPTKAGEEVVDVLVEQLPALPAHEPAPTMTELEGRIDRELTRLGVGEDSVELEVDVNQDGSVDLCIVGDEPVELHRDAELVLSSLNLLPDGAGLEAIRAKLCGQEPKVEKPASRAMIERELERLDCAGVIEAVGAPHLLSDPVLLNWTTNGEKIERPAGAFLNAFILLPDGLGARATWAAIAGQKPAKKRNGKGAQKVNEAA
jgi:hypothetical protein